MPRKFTTTLCPKNTRWDSGYAGGPGINLAKIADDVFVDKVPGPWLAVYMLRRFGWPNIGSDDHKDLCSWMLTTPIAGLYLVVAPYLGPSNLHFAVRFTREVGNKVDADPGRESFVRRRERAVRRWWDKHGSELYLVGAGKVEGEENELVHKAEGSEKNGKVWGLWKRLPSDERHAACLDPADHVVRREWYRVLRHRHEKGRVDPLRPRLEPRRARRRLHRVRLARGPKGSAEAELEPLGASAQISDSTRGISSRRGRGHALPHAAGAIGT